MRNLAFKEINEVSGGFGSWAYNLTDVVDDISNMALLGIGVNIIASRAFNMQVIQQGAYLGATIGLGYSLFNFVGYGLVEE